MDEPNGLILGQRAGDRRFLVLVNYRRADQGSGQRLENVDGLNVDLNATTVGPLFEKNRPRRGGVHGAEGRGPRRVRWPAAHRLAGRTARLSLSDYWQHPA